jgi:thymidylate kinase
MPQIQALNNQSLTDLGLPLVASFDPAKHPFYSAMFIALKKHGVRNRTLHSEGDLLCGFDLAIHPADTPRLALAFAELCEGGYRAVQTVKLSCRRYRMVFARLVQTEIETAMLEVRVESDASHSGTRQSGGRSLTRRLLHRLTTTPSGWGIRRQAVGNSAFTVFLGPDGVGKTTLLRQVCSALTPIFAAQDVYRWRPGRLAPTRHPACLPHAKPMRGFRRSISYLSFMWADFMSGYLLKTRRVMRRSTLVVFDRYYHDLLIDPKRYRYNGPMWLASMIGKLIPPRDIFFLVLDANEHAIFARKQQLAIEEIKRQRIAYHRFAQAHKNAVVIETDQPLPQCREQALEALLRYLAEKNHRLMSRWFHWPAESPQKLNSQSPCAEMSSVSPARSTDQSPAF